MVRALFRRLEGRNDSNACDVNQTGGWLRDGFGKNCGNKLATFDWEEMDKATRGPNLTPAFSQLQHHLPRLGNPAKANAMLKRYQELQQQETKEEEDPTNNSLVQP